MKKIFKTSIFLALFIISGLIILNTLGYLASPKDIILSLANPGQVSSSKIAFKISNFFSFIEKIKSADQENIDLILENQTLMGQVVQLQEIEKENDYLRRQLGLSLSEANNFVLANIIGSEPTNLGRYLLIDKGSDDGLKKDKAVIVAGNLLVGRISEVNSSQAKILLISDQSSLVNAVVQGSEIKGVVKGQQSENLIMDLVLQEEDVEEEYRVITSGLAGIFPAGLLIGEIEDVMSSDPQIFQQARIKPAADLKHLSKVFVILN